MGRTYITQHRYVQQVLLSAENITGLTGSEYAWRLNSLYDPDFTGVGHQPLGFDQMVLFYNNYTVYKVNMTVKIMHSTGTAPCIVFGTKNSQSNYTPGSQTPADVAEKNGYMCMKAKGDNDEMSYSKEVWVADVDGIPRSQIYNDLTYQGSATTSPIRTPYFGVACGTIDANPPASCYVWVCLEFSTVWTNPKVLAQS